MFSDIYSITVWNITNTLFDVLTNGFDSLSIKIDEADHRILITDIKQY